MAELYIGENQIGGGGSPDLSNYYNKSEIDSSFGETYLVKITNASGYYCYVPRTMSDADRQIILSKLNANGGIVKTAYNTNNTKIGTNSNAEGYLCIASGYYSHAEGSYTTASGYYSHAEGGSNTTASGTSSHAEGSNTTASGSPSHAEGYYTAASGNYSHAEGLGSTASGLASHAEGYETTASGYNSHAEGYLTKAKKLYQHVEGKLNADASNAIHIIGNGTADSSRHNALEVHLSGDVKISDTHAAGEAYQKPMFILQDKLYQIDSSITALEANSGTADLTDYYTKSEVDVMIPTVPTAISSFTNDTGYITNNDTSIYALKSELPTVPTAISSFTNDTGYITDNDTSIYALKSELPTVPTAISSFTNDTGYVTDNDTSVYALKSEVDSSFGETYLVKITNASGYYCYVPRTMSDADRQTVLSKLNTNGGIVKDAIYNIVYIGKNSHQEGWSCKASGDTAHAEGYLTTASGKESHAEGYLTTASGKESHAEGYWTTASGDYSHAEGLHTTASGNYGSHAEGCLTTASGSSSHAEGYYTAAKLAYQHAEGRYNADESTAVLIIGNGDGDSYRHNALQVHLSGDIKISDTYASGAVYEKPMFVLQDRLHSIDTSINTINANINYISTAVLSNVNFVIMNEVDYELITPDPSIIYFLT